MVLENLPTKQRTTGAQAMARSTLVRRLRIALPALAVALVIFFFATSKPNQVDSVFLEDFAEVNPLPEEFEMANPNFSGIDSKGQPFEITAKEGLRQAQDDKYVSLNSPRAVTQGQGERTIVAANDGIYETDAKVLQLSNDVTLEHTVGVENYVLRANQATVLIDEERVETETGVRGEDKNGNTLSADKMKAFQNEGRVVFEGNVKLKIRQSDDTNGLSVAPGGILRGAATGSENGRAQE